jgi:hypothetical protein
MADKTQAVKVPEPPQITLPGHPGIPQSVRDEWKRVYGRSLERGVAQATEEVVASGRFEAAIRAERVMRLPKGPEEMAAYCLHLIPAQKLSRLHQAARIEANKLLSVTAPESYANAMALPQWWLLARGEKSTGETGRRLVVVTIDGKKLSFPVPDQAAA